MVYATAKFLLLPWFRLFVKEVKGIGNVPKKGGFVIVANHSSFIDPLVLAGVLIPVFDQKIHFLAKPVGIWHFLSEYVSVSWAGCIPIKKTKLVHKKPLPIAIEMLKKGEIIGIFPEGTRNYGKLLKAHTGVARLAVEGFPIIPIGIKGTNEIWPRNRTFPRLKRAAKIIIGKPMRFKKIKEKDINKKILDQITSKIMKKIGKLINPEYRW